MLEYFSRDELHDELRRIFAVMAEQICVVAGGEAADTFIGLEETGMLFLDYQFPETRLSEIDVSRFSVTHELEAVYDQVFQPSSAEDMPFDVEMAEMWAFLGAIPKTTVDRQQPNFLSKEGKAIQLAEYAITLARIYTFLWGAFTERSLIALSAREIALFGRLSEGTVRNAMSGKSPKLRSFSLADGGARVPIDVALRWLSERRGYQTRPVPISSGLAETILGSSSLEEARTWFATALHWNVGSAKKAAEELGWDVTAVEAALLGDFPSDEAKQRALARLCRINEDRFVAGVTKFKNRRSRETSK